MYTTLLCLVDFSGITLAQTLAYCLLALALVIPAMSLELVIEKMEAVYWVNLFKEEPAHFVLPPEIASLPTWEEKVAELSLEIERLWDIIHFMSYEDFEGYLDTHNLRDSVSALEDELDDLLTDI